MGGIGIGMESAARAPDLRQQLQEAVDGLPDVLAGEVIDFILFVRDRHSESVDGPNQSASAHGCGRSGLALLETVDAPAQVGHDRTDLGNV
jgi:hypothetical protein